MAELQHAPAVSESCRELPGQKPSVFTARPKPWVLVADAGFPAPPFLSAVSNFLGIGIGWKPRHGTALASTTLVFFE